jgi:hypothetical protein
VAAGCDVRVSDKGGVSLDINEGGRAEDESTQSYPLSKGGRIDLETNNGGSSSFARPALRGGARPRQVRAKTDEEAKELLKQQSFTVETTPDRVTIRAAKPEGLEACAGESGRTTASACRLERSFRSRTRTATWT